MSPRDRWLEPEFESLLRPAKINRQAPPELRLRALARARAFVAAKGVILPSAPPSPALVSIPSAPRRARRTIAFAAAMAVAAGTAGALAAFHDRAAEPAPVVTAVSTVGMRAAVAAPPAPRSPVVLPPARAERAPKPRSAVANRAGGFEHRFTAELELLQRAQVAYTRREFSSALGLLAEHARLFSRGHLAEEREALRVRCLRGAGRTDEAHRVAAEFAVRFPRSVLLSGVDSAENE